MKTREARGPSHRTDGKRVVLPIPQQIALMAKSAQKFAVNHLWDNDYSRLWQHNFYKHRYPELGMLDVVSNRHRGQKTVWWTIFSGQFRAKGVKQSNRVAWAGIRSRR